VFEVGDCTIHNHAYGDDHNCNHQNCEDYELALFSSFFLHFFDFPVQIRISGFKIGRRAYIKYYVILLQTDNPREKQQHILFRPLSMTPLLYKKKTVTSAAATTNTTISQNTMAVHTDGGKPCINSLRVPAHAKLFLKSSIGTGNYTCK